MATLATSAGAGTMTLTGSGYTGTSALVVVAFTATDNKRRTLEMASVPVTGGLISTTIPQPYSGGTVVAKSVDPVAATLATATNLGV